MSPKKTTAAAESLRRELVLEARGWRLGATPRRQRRKRIREPGQPRVELVADAEHPEREDLAGVPGEMVQTAHRPTHERLDTVSSAPHGREPAPLNAGVHWKRAGSQGADRGCQGRTGGARTQDPKGSHLRRRAGPCENPREATCAAVRRKPREPRAGPVPPPSVKPRPNPIPPAEERDEDNALAEARAPRQRWELQVHDDCARSRTNSAVARDITAAIRVPAREDGLGESRKLHPIDVAGLTKRGEGGARHAVGR